MKLIHRDLLIEQDVPKEKTASGIYIAETIATYPPIGTVRALGIDISDIKIGDRVVFEPYGGKLVEENLLIVPYEAVLAIIK